MLTEAEVDALPPEKRLDECPLCGCKEHENYERCFHCAECGYWQCCDYDGFYDRARKKPIYQGMLDKVIGSMRGLFS